MQLSQPTLEPHSLSPSRRPSGALLSFGEFLSYLYFASAVSDIFIINVINNIRIRFIISFYVICAVIYCSGRSLDRTGRVLGLLLSNPCLLKLFYYYTP